MNFTSNIQAQLAYLQRMRANITDKLNRLPKGTLKCRNRNGKPYYALYDSESKKEVSLARDPSKRNLYLFRQELEQQLHAVESNIAFLENLAEGYIPINPAVLQWNIQPSHTNNCHPEDRKHLYQGVHYRSKSEVAIASMLTSYNIPFQYEVRLNLRGRTFYPDFYIKRPRDGKIFLWEHFGKITDENYLKKSVFQKLEDYHAVGIDLWDSLIASFDQADGSLNADTIDKLIHLYLL